MLTIKDLTGVRFGRLLVVKQIEKDPVQGIMWLCKCDCGTMCKVSGNGLRSGKGSCGCARRGGSVTQRRLAEIAATRRESFAELEKGYKDTPSIVVQLNAKWMCPHPVEKGCMRNSVAKLCCCECDKREHCELACKNRPNLCGGKKWVNNKK